jgi:hypothetical protein
LAKVRLVGVAGQTVSARCGLAGTTSSAHDTEAMPSHRRVESLLRSMGFVSDLLEYLSDVESLSHYLPFDLLPFRRLSFFVPFEGLPPIYLILLPFFAIEWSRLLTAVEGLTFAVARRPSLERPPPPVPFASTRPLNRPRRSRRYVRFRLFAPAILLARVARRTTLSLWSAIRSSCR